ncbi:hypothetical protein COLO4_25008 [Corchorus olitorius]|uniref:Uncharacterized protein n=1 Tax=Corchorus olitorius TaxID=93759 RepID=A0A1R3I5B1_9ROSI|nr:hypothetical protein COLO4_25008 [Corchorus olitorius]
MSRNRKVSSQPSTEQIKEEEIKAGKEKALGLYKAVEAYLLANPDVCN